MYKIELHPAAVKELEETFLWYEERSEGLGARFIASVNKSLQIIISNPELYRKKKNDYREATVSAFPYIIVYEILKKDKIIFPSYASLPQGTRATWAETQNTA